MSNKGFAGTWAVGVLAQAITTGYFPFTSEDPVDLLKEIESGRRREAKGISDLGKDFFGMMLDPSREGRITARIALAHPWVAPFAKVPSLPRPPKELPKLLSAAKDEDMERAMEGTEVWVRKLVPVHLDKVARELLRCNGRLTNGGERQGGLLDKFAPTSLIEKIKNFRF